MTAPASAPAVAPLLQKATDFSLVLGGPLYQLWRGTRLAGDTLQLLHRRIIALALLTWAPLLLLSMAAGRAWGDSVRVPFLHDVDLHVRLLLALPLLVVAELVIHQRMRPMVGQFLERGLIPETRPCAVRRGDRRGVAPAQLGRSGGLPDCLRLRRRGRIHLADAVGARRRELVRRIGRREMAAVAGRVVAGRGEPAVLPVPAPALVLSPVHLDAVPLARVAY